jgi:ribosomal 30S subunit maturation factor RimM
MRELSHRQLEKNRKHTKKYIRRMDGRHKRDGKEEKRKRKICVSREKRPDSPNG